jgi:hypothetical protein
MQIPGLVPDTQPSVNATPEVNLATPVEAFGGAVGHALQGFGDQIERSGNQIWQRAVELQNLQNETDAKNADANYMMKSGILHANFVNKEGLNAGPEALKAHIQELQDLRTSIRDGLSNPAAQKMYDASSLNFMGRNIFNAAGHSGQQVKVAANHASSARIDQLSDGTGDNPEDDVMFQRNTRAIDDEVRQMGARMGWSEDQINETSKQEISSAIAKRAVGLAKTDVGGAQSLVDAASKQGRLLPNDEAKVRGTIQTQNRVVASRNISSQVLKTAFDDDPENPQKSLKEYVAEGRAAADKVKGTDELLPDYVEDRIITDFSKRSAITRNGYQTNLNIVGRALNQPNKEGILPTTPEELMISGPAVGPAYDSLKEWDKRKIWAGLKNNATQDRVQPTPENLTLFHGYKGMAGQGDDDQRAQFLATNFFSDRRLTIDQRNTLGNIQDKMRAQQGTSNPNVSRALKLLRPDLEAAGLSPKADHDGYFQYVGALEDEVDAVSKDGKIPSLDELRTMHGRLTQDIVTSKGFLWDSKSKMYAAAPPSETADKIRNDPAWARRGITPTDADIQRQYVYALYQKLYGKSAAPKDESKVPSGPKAPSKPSAPVSQ